MTCQYTPPPIEPPSKLSLAQFDYAWKWFSFHADQRTKMFNFMLIIFGFIVGAIATTYEKLPIFTFGVSILGAVLAIIFSRIDWRNREMLGWGEDILRTLESSEIYKEFKIEHISAPSGILWRQTQQDAARKAKYKCPRKLRWHIYAAFAGRHRYTMQIIIWLFAAAFCLVSILAWRHFWNYSEPIPDWWLELE